MPSLPRSHNIVGRWVPSAGATGPRLVDRVRSNHGTLTSMDAASDWVASGGKGALDLDGSNDSVECGKLSTFPQNNWTIAAWCYPRANNSGMVAIGSAQVTRQYLHMFVNGTSNPASLRFHLYADDAVVSSFSLNFLNKWIFVAWTFDTNNFGRFYLDGLAFGTRQYNGSFAGTNDLAIGRGDGVGSRVLNGQIDDITIYNTALTANEVAQIYRLGRGYGVFPEPDFDEGFAAAGFKAYWARRQSQLIGGGV